MSPKHRDPRPYQITILGALIVYGVVALDFEIRPAIALTLLAVAQAGQWLCGRLAGLRRFDPRSAMISALSLILLLRTESVALAAAAALLAIASKFVLRWRGKHVFNPTNFGLAVMMLASERVWVSPGQWGTAAYLALLVACSGVVVTWRAARSDVTWAFLAAYAALLCARAAWLGDPWAIPLHQLQNGALLIFTFFMISDPKTTPDARAGRLVYAAVVALVAVAVQFVFYRPSGPIWALFACAPLVPVIDRLWPAARYRWAARAAAEGELKPQAAAA
ncbi:MAG: hypothetical protein D6696_10920 [Acidobacteria bacterium]|nr:MAG: hypothetical protein D6696_10920 [Acidobacteriota bacterium]